MSLVDMLRSRKFVAMIVGLIVQLGGRYGLELDQEALSWCVALIVAYILGQSVADHGVAPAKITAAADTKIAETKRESLS